MLFQTDLVTWCRSMVFQTDMERSDRSIGCAIRFLQAHHKAPDLCNHVFADLELSMRLYDLSIAW